jgi:hypothetical protein
VKSRFHEDALQLLGLPYRPDALATEALAKRSAQLGLSLPAAFAEWYGMENAIELLRKHSNCDDPIIWEAEHQADWWISSETEDGLAAVTHELWACSDLSSSLYGLEERGERVLEMLRKPQ